MYQPIDDVDAWIKMFPSIMTEPFWKEYQLEFLRKPISYPGNYHYIYEWACKLLKNMTFVHYVRSHYLWDRELRFRLNSESEHNVRGMLFNWFMIRDNFPELDHLLTMNGLSDQLNYTFCYDRHCTNVDYRSQICLPSCEQHFNRTQHRSILARLLQPGMLSVDNMLLAFGNSFLKASPINARMPVMLQDIFIEYIQQLIIDYKETNYRDRSLNYLEFELNELCEHFRLHDLVWCLFLGNIDLVRWPRLDDHEMTYVMPYQESELVKFTSKYFLLAD